MKATRRSCPNDLKAKLLEDQGYICAYCQVPFGSVIRKGSRLRLSVVNFDHVIPHAYLGTNPRSNWVAACNFCNQMKSSEMFASWEDVRGYIEYTWLRKRMAVEWLAPVSSEEHPERWAVKFGTYLAGMPTGLAGSIRMERPWVVKSGTVKTTLRM